MQLLECIAYTKETSHKASPGPMYGVGLGNCIFVSNIASTP